MSCFYILFIKPCYFGFLGSITWSLKYSLTFCRRLELKTNKRTIAMSYCKHLKGTLLIFILSSSPQSGAEPRSGAGDFLQPTWFTQINIGTQLVSDDLYPELTNGQLVGLIGGLEVNDRLSLTLGYQYQTELSSNSYAITTSILDANAKFRYGLADKHFIYGSAGGAYWRSQYNDIERSGNGISPVVGLGYQYEYGRSLSFDAGYRYLYGVGSRAIGSYDGHQFLFGIKYRFGFVPQKQVKVASVHEPIEPPVPLEPKPVELLTLTLDHSKNYFKTGSYQVEPAVRYELAEVIKILKQEPKATANIIGHTDSTGNAENNLVLSEKRALSIAEVIYREGVEFERLKIVGKGQSQPIESNETRAGRQANRRVEVEVLLENLTSTRSANEL
ncbi:outer membrane protein A precursor [Vibrio variabilis]|uniref:Outer membrane protein A n=1 Tax=Vibrio variabilis TaxID=990271 RepID=A0ABQ0JNL6_9VIBR|nr:outer membrane protein A precursor [Vibrio variabilis]